MKIVNKLKDRKGVSPVIATVILVAVAITVSVAVAYWMSGIAGQYTSFEKIELPAHYSQWITDLDGDGGAALPDEGWKEFIELKNSGSRDSTITNIFLNNIPIKDYTYGSTGFNITLWVGDETGTSLPLDAPFAIQIGNGESEKIILWIMEGTSGCSSGTTIDLKIVTAAGNQYPMLEVLA